MSMLDNVKIWLLHSPFENVEILGRKSGDYVRREFGAYCAGEINDADECELRDGETGVILSLGAPLVTVEDVENGVECLRRRKLGKLFRGARLGRLRIQARRQRLGLFFLVLPILQS